MSFENNNNTNPFNSSTGNQNNTGYTGNTENTDYKYNPDNNLSSYISQSGTGGKEQGNSTPSYYSGYGSYSQTPPQPAMEPVLKPKKPASNAFKMIAAMAAVAVIAGASGGGVSYMILKNNPPIAAAVQAPVPDVQNDIIPAQVQESSAAAPQSQPGGAASNSPGLVSDISGVVEKSSESVVEIKIEAIANNPFFGQYTTGGSGSGVILTSDGYIATNDHVIEGAEKITVRTRDGEEYEATLIGTDPQSDLAVIKIDADGLNPATFADSDSIKVGEVAIAIGNPLGTLGGTVTQGIISAKDREIDFETDNGVETMNLIQTSAAVNPGNSGGGLFNANGDLVGIVNLKSTGNNVEGLGFAIPSNTVQKVTDDLIRNGYVTGRPQLGISVVEVFDSQAAFRYRVSEPGVYVAMSTENNGLVSGDLIVSIEGNEIQSSSDVKNSIIGKNVGDTVEMIVKRDGQNASITVTLTEKIPESVRQTLKDSDV